MRADIPGKGPIEFEGRLLPDAAKHFEAVPFYQELPTDLRDWLLDLRYAWARERTAPSRLILCACDELETRIYAERERVFAHLRKVSPGMDSAEVCEQWLSAIMIMRGCAEQRDFCTWTTRPQPGEIANFVGVAVRITRSMISTQNAKRPSDDQIPNPAVLDVIESRPEDEQIAFINSVMDGLSERKAELGASPNGGPAVRFGNSAAREGPPSVS